MPPDRRKFRRSQNGLVRGAFASHQPLTKRLRTRLLAFAKSLGARHCRFEITGESPAFCGTDKFGGAFRLLITGTAADWHLALDMLSSPDHETSGLLRYLRAEQPRRSLMLDLAASYPRAPQRQFRPHTI